MEERDVGHHSSYGCSGSKQSRRWSGHAELPKPIHPPSERTSSEAAVEHDARNEAPSSFDAPADRAGNTSQLTAAPSKSEDSQEAKPRCLYSKVEEPRGISKEVAMKAKPTWKSAGHSAKKWREMAQRRGSLAESIASRPPRRKQACKKTPFA